MQIVARLSTFEQSIFKLNLSLVVILLWSSPDLPRA